MPGIGQHFNRFLERTVRRLARNITLDLRNNTPVDTGLAQSSWIPLIGDRHDVAIDSVAVQRSKQVAGLVSLSSFRLPHGQISISNGQPYIRRLDRGHSAQAPRGFVRRSIRSAIAKTRRDITAGVRRV